MNKNLSIFLVFLTVILNTGCESTGICTEPVTPDLMIGFSRRVSLNNEEKISPPANLNIYGRKDDMDILGNIGSDTTYIFPQEVKANSDKLIPLPFDVNRDELEYILYFEPATEEDSAVYDTIKLSYNRIQSFINVNCGYKSTFQNVSMQYSTNKITEAFVLDTSIEFDNGQHIKIFISE